MTKQLVITEKPSVARDISEALGGFVDEKEYLESEDFVVTWAVGHLLELAEPQEYDPKFRSWSIKNLPIIPEDFMIKPKSGQKKRLDLIKKLAKRKDVDGLINACDAGREGELIYRRIVEFNGIGALPQRRLWLQSMTPQAIRDAFKNLRDGSDLDRMADAAYLRGVGDWLVWMNATRALTQRLRSKGERSSWSAGRVQTPTLGMVVKREREILAHVPRPYWELVATFEKEGNQWEGRYYDVEQKKSDDEDAKPSRVFDRAIMDALVESLKAASEYPASETRKKSKQNPPLLFDLTSLQREANRRHSMSAKRTLEAAQRLYEGHKLLTYPRTDSRYLPSDYEPTVRGVLDALAGTTGTELLDEHAKLAQKVVTGGPQNLDKLLNTEKVSDHFAIVPTGNPVERELEGDDARVYNLVVRQFLAAMMGPATWAVVERFVDVPHQGDTARFRTTARSLEIPGFLEALGQEAGVGSSLPALIAGKDEVDGVPVSRIGEVVEDKETRPPGRFSEAQLLRMMETAGSQVDDDDLADAMKERGLGTPATRADIIERLTRTKYMRRVEGKLVPTVKAMRLMDLLERVQTMTLASAELTGEWQFGLSEVESGKITRNDMMERISTYTREIVDSLANFDHEVLYQGEAPVGICPECGGKVIESSWGYPCENNTRKKGEGCSFMMWKDRNGRYIDRHLARRLLDERTVGPISGFLDFSGKRTMLGTLTLRKDVDKWVLDLRYGDAEASEEGAPLEEVEEGVLMKCPVHGDDIVTTNMRYVCRKVMTGEERTGPILPRQVCKRPMSEDEAKAFFGEEGRTEVLTDFISKRGRPFRGLLFRKPTGKHGFEFPPREKKEGDDKKPAAKKTPAKKTTAKKPAAKKTTTKKTTTAKKTTAKKTTAKKAPADKPAAKKTTTRKRTTKKTEAGAETQP